MGRYNLCKHGHHLGNCLYCAKDLVGELREQCFNLGSCLKLMVDRDEDAGAMAIEALQKYRDFLISEK